jgi:hypothetical protein
MKHDQQQELPQSVYRLAADSRLTLLTKELTAPNGLAFLPNGKYLYIDDDGTRTIRRYNFHKDGTISDGMVFGDMTDPVNGQPDVGRAWLFQAICHRRQQCLCFADKNTGIPRLPEEVLTGATRPGQTRRLRVPARSVLILITSHLNLILSLPRYHFRKYPAS